MSFGVVIGKLACITLYIFTVFTSLRTRVEVKGTFGLYFKHLNILRSYMTIVSYARTMNIIHDRSVNDFSESVIDD